MFAQTPPGRLLNRSRGFVLREVVIILGFHVPSPAPIPPQAALQPHRQLGSSLPVLAACPQINHHEPLPVAKIEPNTIAEDPVRVEALPVKRPAHGSQIALFEVRRCPEIT